MQQEGDSQRAELGQKPSASSVRGKNSTCDGQRVHLAEAEVGTSLSSSGTLPVCFGESQTPSSTEQSILPTGGNDLWQQVVQKGVGSWFPPQASQNRKPHPG